MNKLFKEKNPKRIAMFLILLTFFIGIATMYSNAQNGKYALLNGIKSSQGETLAEGVSVDVQKEGSLSNKDLKLKLGFSGDVDTVKMSLAKSEDSIKEEKRGMNLGLSAQSQKKITVLKVVEPVIEETKTLKSDMNAIKIKKSLGSSQKLGASGDGAEETDQDFALEGSTGKDGFVEFDAPSPGIYVFDLYDTMGNFVGQTFTNVLDVRNDGALELEMTEGYYFTWRDPTNVTLTYTPQITNEKERLTIILPPFFDLKSPVNSEPDYTITTGKIDLPQEYYADAPHLINYESSAMQTRTIDIVFEPHVENALVLTLTLQYNTGYNRDMGKLMELYGAEPYNVPLRIIAKGESLDGSVLVDQKIIEGTSRLTNASGSEEEHNPPDHRFAGPNDKISLQADMKTQVFAMRGRAAPIIATGRHYPITDVFYYMPLPEGDVRLSPNIRYDEILDIDGKTYYKIKQPDVTTPGQGYWYWQDWNVYPPHTDELLQGDRFDFGDVYVDYTYMGEKHEKVLGSFFNSFTMPGYSYVGLSRYFLNDEGVWGSGSGGGSVRAQGKEDDGYAARLGNYVWDRLTGVYEDAELTMEFPFEISPTGANFGVSYLASSPPDTPNLPTEIDYYLLGETAPKTMDLISNGGKGTVEFPLLPGEQITKLVFRYDIFPSVTEHYAEIYADNGTHREDGTLLDYEEKVEMKYTFTTPDGMATHGYATDHPEKKPFVSELEHTVTLTRPRPIVEEDGLIFGGRWHRTYNGLETFFLNLHTGDQYKGVPQEIIFKNTVNNMLDYENSVVHLRPDTPEDLAGFSMMSALVTANFEMGKETEKLDVYYKTNLSTDWKLASDIHKLYSPGNREYILEHRFDLDTGEYPTEVKVDMGTIYGDQIGHEGLYGEDRQFKELVRIEAAGYRRMTPRFNTLNRNYFQGDSANEKPVKEDDKWKFSAEFSTDSDAQYITPGPGASTQKNNNIAPLSINGYHLYADYNMSRNKYNIRPSHNPGNYLEQGQTFKFRFGNEGSSASSAFSEQVRHRYRMYLEVYNDFELLENEPEYSQHNASANLLEIKDIPENGTKLYIYEYSSDHQNISNWLTILVRPDAEQGANRPVIRRAGISYDDFRDDYMTPADGPDAYYENAPYRKIVFNDIRPYPIEWGIDDDVPSEINIEKEAQVNIDIKILDTVQQKAKVDNAIQVEVGNFNEHTKNKLAVEAFFGNVSAGTISKYEALFTLPRVDKDTETISESGGSEFLENDFDMYLTGPIKLPSAPASYEITYYEDRAQNKTVTVDENTPPSELRKVTEIIVQINNFDANSTHVAQIPLESLHIKTGDDTEAVAAHVGAGTIKDRDPGTDIFPPSRAQKFVFNSYELKTQIGLDESEDGLRARNLENQAKVTVFYDDNGVKKELYSNSTKAEHTIFVNDDVLEIAVEVINPAEYMLTKQNLTNNDNADSDFPRDGTPLPIDMNDLKNGTLHQYDANLIIKPKIKLEDIEIPLLETKEVSAEVRLSSNNAVIPSWSHYIVSVTAAADPSIATVTYDGATEKITVVGLKKGTTTFDYTVKNRLGDEFTLSNIKIDVVPDYVNVASIKKEFKNESENLGSDTFDFELWKEGASASEKQSITNVANSPQSITTIEKDAVYHLKEVNLPDGYRLSEFTVKSGGVALPLTNENDGVVSFDVAADCELLEIVAINKNLPVVKKVTLLPKGPKNVTNSKVTITGINTPSSNTDTNIKDYYYYQQKSSILTTPVFDEDDIVGSVSNGWIKMVPNTQDEIIGVDGDQLTVFAVAVDNQGHASPVLKSSDVFQVDMTQPVISEVVIREQSPDTIHTNKPVIVEIEYNDPTVQGYASGVKAVYYIAAKTKPAIPTIDVSGITPPVGWTLYNDSSQNLASISGADKFKVYAIAVDNAGNISSDVIGSDDDAIISTDQFDFIFTGDISHTNVSGFELENKPQNTGTVTDGTITELYYIVIDDSETPPAFNKATPTANGWKKATDVISVKEGITTDGYTAVMYGVAKNNFGNWSNTIKGTGKVHLDLTKPKITTFTIGSGATSKDITLMGTDPTPNGAYGYTSGIKEYYYNSVAAGDTPIAFDISLPTANGWTKYVSGQSTVDMSLGNKIDVYAVAVDNTLNVSELVEYTGGTVVFDDTPPVVTSVTLDPKGPNNVVSSTVTIESNDNEATDPSSTGIDKVYYRKQKTSLTVAPSFDINDTTGWTKYTDTASDKITGVDGDQLSVYAVATDIAGNVSAIVKSDDIFQIDLTAPKITNLELMEQRSIPTNRPIQVKIETEDPLVQGYASDVKTVYFKASENLPIFDIQDTSGWNIYDFTVGAVNTATLGENSSYKVYAIAIDNAGNLSGNGIPMSSDEEVIEETGIPKVLSIILAKDGHVNVSETTVEITAQDISVNGQITDAHEIYYNVKKESDSAPTFKAGRGPNIQAENLENGWKLYTNTAKKVEGTDGDELVVYAVANDKSGNISPVLKGNQVFRIDLTQPKINTIVLTKPPGRALISSNGPVNVKITYEDIPATNGHMSDIDKVYYIESDTIPSFDKASWHEYDPVGINTATGNSGDRFRVYAVAVDKAGNTSGAPYESLDEVQMNTEIPTLDITHIHVKQGDAAVQLPKDNLVTASDALGNTIAIDASAVSQTTVPTDTIGRFAVTYTVKDSAGNSTNGIQYIYVHGNVEVKGTDVTAHIKDNQSDFTLIEKQQIKPSASVKHVEANGTIVTVENLPVTMSGTVNWGTLGSNTLTYKADYNNILLGQTITGEKQIIVTIIDGIIPSGPTIQVIEEMLRSIQGFDGSGLVTDSDLLANSSSTAGTVSYTIADDAGNQKTLAEANAAVYNYTVTYKVQDTDGRSAYKEIELRVFGELTYTGLDKIYVNQDITPGAVLPDSLYKGNGNIVTVVYKAANTSNIVEELNGVLTTPTNIPITDYGKYPVVYGSTYPAALNTSLNKSGTRDLYVQGKPVLTADDVSLHFNDTAADFDPAMDPRVNKKAKVVVIADDGSETTIDIASSEVEFVSANIPWGQKNQSGTATYQVTYQHDNITDPITTQVTIAIHITDAVPGGPQIELGVDADNGIYWHFQNMGMDLEKQNILDNLTVTFSNGATEVVGSREVLVEQKQSDGSYVAVDFPDALLVPDAYKLTFKVTDSQGRTGYAYANLHVISEISVAATEILHKAENKVVEMIESDYSGLNGPQASFTNHEKTVVSAVVKAKLPTIALTPVGKTAIEYNVSYPSGYTTPIADYKIEATRDLHVHELPEITAEGFTMSTDEGEPNYLEDLRIGLEATAKKTNAGGTVESVSDIVVQHLSGAVNPGTEGDYLISYEASYDHAGSTYSSTKQITITVSAAGDPEGPQFELSTSGEDTVKYFQSHSNSLTEDNVKDYIIVKDKDGNILTNSQIDFTLTDGAGVPIPTLTDALLQIGKHKIKFVATDSGGRSNYFTMDLIVYGPLKFVTAGDTLNTIVEAGSNLPTADYQGVNNLKAEFEIAPGQMEPAIVTSENSISIGSVGHKNIVYTAKYPDSVATTAVEKAYTKTEDRLVRIHGLPIYQYNPITLHERINPSDAQLLAGITSEVEIAGETSLSGTSMVPVTDIKVVNVIGTERDQMGTFDLTVKGSYILDIGNGATLELSNTNDDRTVILHGRVQVKGNDIALSKNFKKPDFLTIGYPQMNLVASVDYYDNTVPGNIKTVTLSVPNPDPNNVIFGTVGHYPLLFSVSDAGIAELPASLNPDTSVLELDVHISGDIVGMGPIINGGQDKDWLQGTNVTPEDLKNGVEAKDSDGNNLDFTITVKDKDGVIIDIGTGTDLDPTKGPYDVIYETQDNKGNITEKETQLCVHGPLIVINAEDEIVRESVNPYVPNKKGLVVTYIDGKTGQVVTMTKESHPEYLSSDKATYNIDRPKNKTYDVAIKHPGFDNIFVPPSTGVVVETSSKQTINLKVHGTISITGHEKYDANAPTRQSESYNIVGDTLIAPNMSQNSVQASYINSDGMVTAVAVTATPNNGDSSKPTAFGITYSAKDDLIPSNQDVLEKITVQVDSKIELVVGTNPIIVPSGTSLDDVIQYGNITSVIYYGNNPTVAVVLPPAYSLEGGLLVVGQAGDSNTLTINVAQPGNPNNKSNAEVPILVYGKPKFEIVNKDKHIELFKDEFTVAQLTKDIKITASYKDTSGQLIPAKVSFDTQDLNTGIPGHYQIIPYVVDTITKEKIYSEELINIYVLNRAYINHKESYEVYGEDISYGLIEEIIGVQGVGEYIDYTGNAPKSSVGMSDHTNPGIIRVKKFDVTYNFANVSLERYGSYQKVGLHGDFFYREQELSETTKVRFLKGASEGGTNKPDEGPHQGGENTGSGQNNDDEAGMSNSAIKFWRETQKLIEKTGGKNETWKITSTDPLKPTKSSSKGSRVIAVPNEYLNMPQYVLDALQQEKGMSLNLQLGNYEWQLNSNNKWTDSFRANYPIAITATNNRQISKFLGRDVVGQQLAFGFEGGWRTKAVINVKITKEKLQDETLYMYYYNPFTEQLEFVDQMENKGSNWYTANVAGERGEYVITDQFYEDVRIAHESYENPSTGGWDYIPRYARTLLEQGLINGPSGLQIERSNIESKLKIILAICVLLLTSICTITFVAAKKRRKNNQV